MNLGMQMWSVHDVCVTRGFEETFGILKEMGYQGFEYALGACTTMKERCGVDASEAARAARDCGMKILGCHMPASKVLEAPEIILEECKALELPCVGIGAPFQADRTSFDEQRRIEEILVKTAEFFKENGVQMQVHCGVAEFLYDYAGRYAIDGLMEAAGRDLLQPEFDTQWLMCCDVDMAAMFQKYKDCIDVVHLKDSKPVQNQYRYTMAKYDEICKRFNKEGQALGTDGMLDLEQAVRLAGENGAKWLVVELWNEKNALEHARISAQNVLKYL